MRQQRSGGGQAGSSSAQAKWLDYSRFVPQSPGPELDDQFEGYFAGSSAADDMYRAMPYPPAYGSGAPTRRGRSSALGGHPRGAAAKEVKYSAMHNAYQRSKTPPRHLMDEQAAKFEALHKGKSPFFLKIDKELGRWYAGLPATNEDPLAARRIPRPTSTVWPRNVLPPPGAHHDASAAQPEESKTLLQMDIDLPNGHHFEPEDLLENPDYATLRRHVLEYNDAAYSRVADSVMVDLREAPTRAGGTSNGTRHENLSSAPYQGPKKSSK